VLPVILRRECMPAGNCNLIVVATFFGGISFYL